MEMDESMIDVTRRAGVAILAAVLLAVAAPAQGPATPAKKKPEFPACTEYA